MKITKIKENPNNPRVIEPKSFAALVESLKNFPKMMSVRPIVVDDDGIILGGNMRYKALLELGYKEIPNDWVKKASDFTEEEKQEFLIKDNSNFGEWDWQALSEMWDADKLSDWGVDLIGEEIDDSNISDSFKLPEGDKSPFQQITFTLADEQIETMREAIKAVKADPEFSGIEFENKNSNGNAIFYIVNQWMQANSQK